MRKHGTLIRWNRRRGVGAIAPADGGSALFVHVSAFPRDGVPPRIGELLSYLEEAGATGEPHAIRIERLGRHPGLRYRLTHGGRRLPRQALPLASALTLLILLLGIWRALS